MFRWHKELHRLDIPAQRVLHLKRSLSPVQVALPGCPSQEATAYLCAFAEKKGVRVSVALYLQASRQLAFYLHDRVEPSRERSGRLIEEGILFAESMGFTLTNLDYQELAQQDQVTLWESLPLRGGVEPSVPVAVDNLEISDRAPVTVAPEMPVPMHSQEPEAPVSPEPVAVPAVETVVELEETVSSTPAITAEMPSGILPESSPAPVARKRRLSAGEMAERRKHLLEGLGRFLASL